MFPQAPGSEHLVSGGGPAWEDLDGVALREDMCH